MKSRRCTAQHTWGGPGFTLIELLVTLAILSVLALVTVPLAQVQVQRGKEHELRMALRDIRGAIDAYKRAADEGHIARPPGSTGYPPNLEVLVEGVEDRRAPTRRKVFFLRRIPVDPMESNGTSDATPNWGLRSYQSEGDDPQPGDDIYDVYTRSKRVGLNGAPYYRW